jgi:hypothetical protein
MFWLAGIPPFLPDEDKFLSLKMLLTKLYLLNLALTVKFDFPPFKTNFRAKKVSKIF